MRYKDIKYIKKRELVNLLKREDKKKAEKRAHREGPTWDNEGGVYL